MEALRLGAWMAHRSLSVNAPGHLAPQLTAWR